MQPGESFSQIEDKLRRGLMPVALSEAATDSMHAMLDELAGDEPAAVESGREASRAPWMAAAAAVAVLLAGSAWLGSPVLERMAFTSAAGGPSWTEPGDTFAMQLVDESTRLAWVEDEGWLADPDGGALHAVRMGVIEENRLLDEETGIIVHVSSPREEMLLMPVTTF